MDAEILQGEIEAVQEGLLAVDQKVDELEAEQAPSPVAEAEGSSSTPVEPVIDLAQTVGRLEAQVAQCQSEIASLQIQVSLAQSTAEVALIPRAEEPMTEPEVTIAEVATEPEPESEEESEEEDQRSPNWLERLLLVR